MKNKPKISVIMPCLNVQKYIIPCLESVLNQTLKELEILVIDAGSTDGTLEILHTYKDKDSRIKIITSDKKSYGYQMNIGITMATGKYIGIVETDDIIELNMFDSLFRQAELTQVDYVKGCAESFFQIKDKAYRSPIFPLEKDSTKWGVVIQPKALPELFISDNFLWNGIYYNAFIKKIKFSESAGAAYQDIGVLFQIISMADRALYINQKVYNYRKDNMEASSYSRNSFHYLINEYGRIEKLYLSNLSLMWKHAYYAKMFLLCESIFCVMAATGIFWDDKKKEIEIIQVRFDEALKTGVFSEEDMYIYLGDKWNRLVSFIENAYQFYQIYRKDFIKRSNQIKEILEKVKHHSIVIFGTGNWGKFIYLNLLYHEITTIVGYCDNNAGLWGQSLQGVMITSVIEAVEHYPEAYYIIANKKHSKEMEQQLLNYGIPQKRIYKYTAGTDMKLFID